MTPNGPPTPGERIKASTSWLLRWTINAFLSGLIGGAAGAIVALIWSSREPPVGIALGQGGETAYPGELFTTANGEGKVTFAFNPPELQDVAVCEYFATRGWNWAEQALGYVKAYPECFVVRHVDRGRYEISPALGPGRLLRLDAAQKFSCKCPHVPSEAASGAGSSTGESTTDSDSIR